MVLKYWVTLIRSMSWYGQEESPTNTVLGTKCHGIDSWLEMRDRDAVTWKIDQQSGSHEGIT
jgi:hypothetical protein